MGLASILLFPIPTFAANNATLGVYAQNITNNPPNASVTTNKEVSTSATAFKDIASTMGGISGTSSSGMNMDTVIGLTDTGKLDLAGAAQSNLIGKTAEAVDVASGGPRSSANTGNTLSTIATVENGTIHIYHSSAVMSFTDITNSSGLTALTSGQTYKDIAVEYGEAQASHATSQKEGITLYAIDSKGTLSKYWMPLTTGAYNANVDRFQLVGTIPGMFNKVDIRRITDEGILGASTQNLYVTGVLSTGKPFLYTTSLSGVDPDANGWNTNLTSQLTGTYINVKISQGSSTLYGGSPELWALDRSGKLSKISANRTLVTLNGTWQAFEPGITAKTSTTPMSSWFLGVKGTPIAEPNTDTTPPVINGATDKTININDPFDPKEGVTASDDTDGDLTDRITITGTVDNTTSGSYELTYTVSDSAGNIATAKRTITVLNNGATIACAPQTGDPAISIWQWSTMLFSLMAVGLGIAILHFNRKTSTSTLHAASTQTTRK